MEYLKLFTLFLLYFVQGGPFGFQVGCLPVILRQRGLSYTSLGVLKLLFLPWILKPLIVFWVERRKFLWLHGALIGLGVTCLCASLISPTDIWSLSFLLLMLNALCAIQDICVDCLSVNLMGHAELGLANTVQVVGYKVGSAVASGSALYLENIIGWKNMFIAFGLVYFLCSFLMHKILPLDNNVSEPTTALNLNTISKAWIPGTAWTIALVSFYKLSERSLGIYPLYLLDSGVSKDTIAFGLTLTRIFSIAGSAFGGFLLSGDNRLKPLNIVQTCVPIQTIFLFLQYGSIDNKESYFSFRKDLELLFYNVIYVFCSGLITTSVFTYMMTLSQSVPDPNLRGPYFSILCTFEISGKLLFASMTGSIVDNYGVKYIYKLFTFLSFLNLPLLYFKRLTI